jgi:hypothetical protein
VEAGDTLELVGRLAAIVREPRGALETVRQAVESGTSPVGDGTAST